MTRLADLGDINATKQTQIYLDALSDIGQANPEVSKVLQMIQAGLGQSIAAQNSQLVDND